MTNVAIIWNFWPLSMFIWTPIRLGLNILIFPAYLLTGWIPMTWNFIFETAFFTLNIFLDICLMLMMLIGLAFALLGGLFFTLIEGVLLLVSFALFPMIYTIPS